MIEPPNLFPQPVPSIPRSSSSSLEVKQAESSRHRWGFQVVEGHAYGQPIVVELIRLTCAVAKRPAAVAADPLVQIGNLGGAPIAVLDLPAMRPAVAMHGMIDCRPIALEMKRLAFEDQLAILDAIGVRHQRISGGIVAFAGGNIGFRHWAQNVDTIDSQARESAAGGGRQLDGKTACLQRQKRHGLASRAYSVRLEQPDGICPLVEVSGAIGFLTNGAASGSIRSQ